mmetsp:Transcript_35170/g.88640  ORF Transcript_35170/g.88640 Transcript_35170/m.88640 type:complete len:283 (+) Transcript_35170:694-1542(+)
MLQARHYNVRLGQTKWFNPTIHGQRGFHAKTTIVGVFSFCSSKLVLRVAKSFWPFVVSGGHLPRVKACVSQAILSLGRLGVRLHAAREDCILCWWTPRQWTAETRKICTQCLFWQTMTSNPRFAQGLPHATLVDRFSTRIPVLCDTYLLTSLEVLRNIIAANRLPTISRAGPWEFRILEAPMRGDLAWTRPLSVPTAHIPEALGCPWSRQDDRPLVLTSSLACGTDARGDVWDGGTPRRPGAAEHAETGRFKGAVPAGGTSGRISGREPSLPRSPWRCRPCT